MMFKTIYQIIILFITFLTILEQLYYLLFFKKLKLLKFSNRESLLFLLIIIIWVLEEHILKLCMIILQDLDFWMIEIIIISFFTVKMFKIKIFKHQIFAMTINIIPCLFKICYIILSFYDDTEENNMYTGKLPIIYLKRSYIIIPIGFVIYLILIILRSFINSNIKWYMDLKYISSNKLLFYYGIIGSFILTFVPLYLHLINTKHLKILELTTKQ